MSVSVDTSKKCQGACLIFILSLCLPKAHQISGMKIQNLKSLLSVMDDQKVSLPIAESKKALLNELTYYGIEVGNEEDIDDGKCQGVLATNSLIDSAQLMETCAKEFENYGKECVANGVCAFLVAYIIIKHVSIHKPSFELFINKNNFPRYNDLRELPKGQQLELCNLHLNKAGLQLFSTEYLSPGHTNEKFNCKVK